MCRSERYRVLRERLRDVPTGHRLRHFRVEERDDAIVDAIRQERDLSAARDFKTKDPFVVLDVHAYSRRTWWMSTTREWAPPRAAAPLKELQPSHDFVGHGDEANSVAAREIPLRDQLSHVLSELGEVLSGLLISTRLDVFLCRQ